MVELEPLRQRQRLPPRLDLGQVVHDSEQARAVALVHVVELVALQPFAERHVVGFALGLAIGADGNSGLVHRPLATNLQRLANLDPVVPVLLALQSAPRLEHQWQNIPG